MLGDMILLLGLALFIKVFFDGVKVVVGTGDGTTVSSRKFMIHSLLGITFIIVSRLIVELW